MSLSDAQLIAQIDEVVEASERLANEAGTQEIGGPADEAVARLAAAIDRLTPNPSPYRSQASAALGTKMINKFRVPKLTAVLRAMKTDLEAGYLARLEERIRQDVFEDFLAMAERMNASMHPAPAAVLAGAVLEDHVRKLAAKASLPTVSDKGKAITFEQLSIDLVRAQVFPESQRKVLVAWYGQRTEGAHGHFDRVIREDVPRIISGVREFILRYPA